MLGRLGHQREEEKATRELLTLVPDFGARPQPVQADGLSGRTHRDAGKGAAQGGFGRDIEIPISSEVEVNIRPHDQ